MTIVPTQGLAARFGARRYTEIRKAPGVPGLGDNLRRMSSAPHQTLRYYPIAQIRQDAEPNATFRVGADGETGDFNGLTLSASGPVFLGSRGFSSGKARIA